MSRRVCPTPLAAELVCVDYALPGLRRLAWSSVHE